MRDEAITGTGGLQLSGRVIAAAARLLEAAPADVRVSKLTGDASARVYFRVQVEGDGRSLIAALYSKPFDADEPAAARFRRLEIADASLRLTFANDPCAHIEVTNLLLEGGLPVPRIVAACGEDGVLLIEDVGDVRLQDWLGRRPKTEVRDAYRRAVNLIVLIQDATDAALSGDSICSNLAFDEAKLRWELDFFFDNYFKHYLGLSFDCETMDRIGIDFTRLCAELAGRPRVLTHRDYHARNLMVYDGGIFIIDHQDARMGPESYDLASLLNDPYSSLDEAFRNEMIEWFVELKSRSKRPMMDAKAFKREYELMTIQRLLKAIGTYACQAAVMNNKVYLRYIEPALDRVIAAVRRVEGYGSLREILNGAA